MSESPDTQASQPPEDAGGSAPTYREDAGGSARTDREEAGRSAPTHRGDAASAGAETVREEVGDGAVRQAPSGSLQLPDELQDRYRFIRQSAHAGAEGTLFDVAEVDTGMARVLKLYHGHVSLRADALRRIQAVDAAHAVELIEFGQLTDGRWYEVQERIGGGDLIGYRDRMEGSLTLDQLHRVVSELSAAIAAFHEAGLAHHDIKPENILVRTLDPLDLVLSDFGLAVVAGNRTYYATNRNATIAYQAPETMRQVGGEPRDYWALGLTIAMLATGEVPYAGINDHGILDQHHNRVPPPIVESIPDGRVKQLCRGLTRYNPEARWTSHEISGWLHGADPDVAPEGLSELVDARRVVRFNQSVFSDGSELADEMVRCWSLTAQTIAVESRRSPFMDELILAMGSESLARLADRWVAAPPARDEIDSAIVELVLTLDPTQEAQFRGRRLTRDLVAAAALSGSDDDRGYVVELHNRDILAAWGRSPRYRDLAGIAERWHAAMRRASEISIEVDGKGARAPDTDDWAVPLLAISAREELIEDWVQQRRDARLKGEFVPEWHTELVTGDDPVGAVAAVLLAGEAQRIQRRDQEAALRAKAAVRVRRRERLYRSVLRALGWLAALALLAGPALEWAAAGQFDAGLPPGALLLRGQVPLVMLTMALLCQAHYSDTSRRKAEALSLVALASIGYWIVSRDDSVLSVDPGAEVEQLLSLAETSYAVAALIAVIWAAVSWLYRRNEDPPNDQRIAALRRSDRSDIKATAWFTLTCVVPVSAGLLLILAPAGEGLPPEELGRLFEASPWDVGWAALAAGVWLPLVFGGLGLLARGRWQHRRAGTIWALALLASGTIAWFAGQAISDARLDAARALLP